MIQPVLDPSTELHAKNLVPSNELVSFCEYVLAFLKETIPHQYPLLLIMVALTKGENIIPFFLLIIQLGCFLYSAIIYLF